MMKATRAVSPLPDVKAWLVVHGGPQDGLMFRLRQNAITVGADSKLSDLVLKDETVSREHIRLRNEGGQFVLTDLASLNGTLVNNQSAQSCLLMDGDVIKIGNTTLIYKYVAAAVG
jgi:two-component system, NtrC family, response regulator GlrR